MDMKDLDALIISGETKLARMKQEEDERLKAEAGDIDRKWAALDVAMLPYLPAELKALPCWSFRYYAGDAGWWDHSSPEKYYRRSNSTIEEIARNETGYVSMNFQIPGFVPFFVRLERRLEGEMLTVTSFNLPHVMAYPPFLVLDGSWGDIDVDDIEMVLAIARSRFLQVERLDAEYNAKKTESHEDTEKSELTPEQKLTQALADFIKSVVRDKMEE
jgi:hypothetical protein